MMPEFAINPGKVVHETVDGETILIHLETGNYYSLSGAGAEIWGLVGTARSPGEIARELAERHGRTESEVSPAVTTLLTQLMEEGLLEPNGSGPTSPDASLTVWRAASWVPPKLERYDDMQDFLLVDPIHEVDDAGWPSRKTG
jgi:hypothetical protein